VKRWAAGTALLAVAVYALLWFGFARWGWVERVDDALLDPLHDFGAGHPGWVLGWDLFCTLLGPTAFRLAGVVLIIVALARRNVRVAMFLVITVEMGGIVTLIAKDAADRPRPSTALVLAPSSSFPSGHAVGVTVAVLALLTVAWPVVSQRTRRWLLVAGIALIVVIGAGRVVLNVHHPSDVLAGWALGYAYFVLCVLVLPPLRPITAADETPATPGSAR
jgi:membrane-associated phospholipid phosphatase